MRAKLFNATDVENVSVYISRSSPVSTLLLLCVPHGGVKSSEVAMAIIEEDAR